VPSQREGQPFGWKQWEQRTHLIGGINAGQTDAFLAVFFFKSDQPTGVVIDESTFMRGDKLIPARVVPKIQFDGSQSAPRTLQFVDYHDFPKRAVSGPNL